MKRKHQDTDPAAEKRQRTTPSRLQLCTTYLRQNLFGPLDKHPAFDLEAHWTDVTDAGQKLLWPIQTVYLTTHPHLWDTKRATFRRIAKQALAFVTTTLQFEQPEATAAFITVQNCYLEVLETCAKHLTFHLQDYRDLHQEWQDWLAMQAREAATTVHTYTRVQTKWTQTAQRSNTALCKLISTIRLLPLLPELTQLVASLTIQLHAADTEAKHTYWLQQAAPYQARGIAETRTLLAHYKALMQ